MEFPRENIGKILVFHRRQGDNFVLYVQGIDLKTNQDEELQSTFYSDPALMKMEINSIIRFLYRIGFKSMKDYLSKEGNRVFAFEK